MHNFICWISHWWQDEIDDITGNTQKVFAIEWLDVFHRKYIDPAKLEWDAFFAARLRQTAAVAVVFDFVYSIAFCILFMQFSNRFHENERAKRVAVHLLNKFSTCLRFEMLFKCTFLLQQMHHWQLLSHWNSIFGKQCALFVQISIDLVRKNTNKMRWCFLNKTRVDLNFKPTFWSHV